MSVIVKPQQPPAGQGLLIGGPGPPEAVVAWKKKTELEVSSIDLIMANFSRNMQSLFIPLNKGNLILYLLI
jgi:hypothetical protein